MLGGKKRAKHIVEKSRKSLMKTECKGKYRGLHKWMRRRIEKPELCTNCQVKPPMDLANISGSYKQDIADWVWLCRKCHQILDGRYEDMKRWDVRGDYSRMTWTETVTGFAEAMK